MKRSLSCIGDGGAAQQLDVHALTAHAAIYQDDNIV
jgi:hypothetical protein